MEFFYCIITYKQIPTKTSVFLGKYDQQKYFWASMISRKIAATEKLGIKQSKKNLNSLELVHDLKDKHAFFLGIKTELKFQLTKSFWQIDSNN